LSNIDEAAEHPPYRLGLTATPERADGKNLAKIWEMAYSYSMIDAMDEGYLVPIRSVIQPIEGLDLSEVSGTSDYSAEELGKVLLRAEVVDHTADCLMEHAVGRKAIVFTATVEQAQLTAEELRNRGWKATHVSGETPAEERARILNDFSNGEIDAICNCAVLTEGTDLPIADCIVVARPTRSKPLYIQMIGRGLRLSPGKEDCLVIDLAGASDEHSLIQAPVLIGILKDERRRAKSGDSPLIRGSKNDPLKGLIKKRRPIKASWVPIYDLDKFAWVCDCGKEGMVAAVQEGNLWMPYWIPKRCRAPSPLSSVPVDLELAYGLGSDVVRRARSLTYPNARWRKSPASEGQLAYAKRLGIKLPPAASKGQAAELITKETAARSLMRLDLAKPVQVGMFG
jgi:hypothetical protein